jgi:hypothetical protein
LVIVKFVRILNVPPYLFPVEVAGAVVLVAGGAVVVAGAVVLVAGAVVVALDVVVGSACEQALKNKTEISVIAKSVKSHFFIKYTSLGNFFRHRVLSPVVFINFNPSTPP